MPHIPDASRFLGTNVSVTYRDGSGDLHTRTTHVYDITATPVQGVRLVCDGEDIWLNAVASIAPVD